MDKELKQFLSNTGPQAISWEKWIEKAKEVMAKQDEALHQIGFPRDKTDEFPAMTKRFIALGCIKVVADIINGKTECEGV